MTPLEQKIIESLEKIGRPLSTNELMVLCLPLTPHLIDQNTGRIQYNIPEFELVLKSMPQIVRQDWAWTLKRSES